MKFRSESQLIFIALDPASLQYYFAFRSSYIAIIAYYLLEYTYDVSMIN
ncbi:MAG: hypothetical protein M5E90_02035 [Asgard group archaeon]|nr:hypothetical protein [Asgard group archaeon]